MASLLQLVAVDEEGKPTRWRVALAELTDQVGAELDRFVAHRLLVADAEADVPVISVCHEAFLSAWSPLAEAIENNAKALKERHAVEREAAVPRRRGGPGRWQSPEQRRRDAGRRRQPDRGSRHPDGPHARRQLGRVLR
ncbi:nSTAND1 domain-containing NTPase [Saccharothrix stipae]